MQTAVDPWALRAYVGGGRRIDTCKVNAGTLHAAQNIQRTSTTSNTLYLPSSKRLVVDTGVTCLTASIRAVVTLLRKGDAEKNAMITSSASLCNL